MQILGKYLILAGILLAVLGVLFYFASGSSWLGRLPGDFVIRKDKFTFYFPLATSLLLSAVVTLILFLLNRR